MKTILRHVLFLSLVLTLSIIASRIALAQNFWEKTNGPYPGGDLSIAIQSLAIDTSGDIFAAANIGALFRSTDDGESWTTVNTGLAASDIYSLAINASGVMFAGTDSGVFRSSDNGNQWVAARSGLTDLDIFSLAINSSSTVFAGTRQSAVFRSTDNGNSWTHINHGFTTTTNVLALLIDRNDVIYAGAGGGGILQSTDNGDSWAFLNKGITNKGVRCLAIDSSGQVFAGTFGGLFRSSNEGLSWTGPILKQNIRSLAINRNGHIFAGTVSRPFMSTDSGENWTSISSGLTDTTVRSLAIEANGFLLGGTIGGSVYRSTQTITGIIPPDGMLPNLYTLAQNYPNPFNPSTTISFSLPSKSFVSLKIFDALGREVAILFKKELTAGTYSRQWNAADLASGVYFYRLQAGSFSETKKLILLK